MAERQAISMVNGKLTRIATSDTMQLDGLGIGTSASSGDITLASGSAVMTELSADPSGATNTGKYYTKDVGGITEAFYIDSSSQAVQITSNGSVNGGGGGGASDEVTLTEQSSHRTDPSAGEAIIYAMDNGLMFVNSDSAGIFPLINPAWGYGSLMPTGTTIPYVQGDGIYREGLAIADGFSAINDDLDGLYTELFSTTSVKAKVELDHDFAWTGSSRYMTVSKFKLTQTTNTNFFFGLADDLDDCKLDADTTLTDYAGIGLTNGGSNFIFTAYDGTTQTSTNAVAVDTKAHTLIQAWIDADSVYMLLLDEAGNKEAETTINFAKSMTLSQLGVGMSASSGTQYSRWYGCITYFRGQQ